jgi:hypothetical protein
MKKEELKFNMARLIGRLACTSPSLRENFWNNFSESQILEIQKSIYDKSSDIIDNICKSEKDNIGFAKHLYSHFLLKDKSLSKIDEAIDEMSKFFKEYINYIYINITYCDSPIHVIYNGPIPFQNVEQYSDISLNEIKSFSETKNNEFKKSMNMK